MAWRGNPENLVPNPIQEDLNRSLEKKPDNRALYVSRETDKLKNFSITIKDIDETVFKHLQKMDLSVIDNGEKIKVPINYASPEKWKSVQNDGFMRDLNGRIILPALIYYRTNSEEDKSLVTFNKYLRYAVLKKYSQKNQYTKFSVLVNENVPINEVYNVVYPDHMVFTYKFIIWTEYIEQMNSLIERINFETNDYWGDSRNFRFRTYVSSYSHTTEVSSDSDRIIKTEFDLALRGYLLPDLFAPGLDNFKSTTEKALTKKKIILGTEVVSTDWKPKIENEVKDKWRSQTFHNLTLEDESKLKELSVKSVDNEDIDNFKNSIKSITSDSTAVWHFPAPTSPTDFGEDGWQSYDDDFYYLYIGGVWKRVPLTSFQ